MKSKLLFPFISCIAVILLNGCTKEGPAGPAGNANVQSSTITFSSWLWDSSNNYDYADFNWSPITSAIVNSGAVFIYVNTATGWVALPRTIYPTSSLSESQRIVYNVGTFRIIVQDSDLNPPNPALGSWTIKVVAVASSIIKTNPNVNWSNYLEVKKTFNLAN